MNIIQAKIVVLGSTGVGKTSIVVRYIGNGFNKYVTPTIGASFFTCKVAIDNYRVKLQVWDTAGQERFRSMAPMYYRKANAAMLVYDITSQDSFIEMKSWVKELQRNIYNKILLCVVGNKGDLKDKREVSLDEALDFAVSINAFHFETSAATAEGITEVFMHIAKSLIFNYESEQDPFEAYNVNNNVEKGITLDSRQNPKLKKQGCCS